MSDHQTKEIIIHKHAPWAMRIRETPWYNRRIDKYTITYEWWCRGCLTTNKKKIETADPLFEIHCEECGLVVFRDCVDNDWRCKVPIK